VAVFWPASGTFFGGRRPVRSLSASSQRWCRWCSAPRNAINHSIVVRRAKVAGIGEATKFETADPEIRFSCRFEALERGAVDRKPVQRGIFTLSSSQLEKPKLEW
jgi:hypothetical protein